RSRSAFLHHVAELTGEGHLAGSRHRGRLDEHDVAAYRRPCQTRRYADRCDALLDLVVEPRLLQVLDQVFRPDASPILRVLRDLARNLSEDRADLSLEVAHTRFASVVDDDRSDRRIADLRLSDGEAVGLALLGEQIPLGDLDLVLLGVARQLDDLHPVA